MTALLAIDTATDALSIALQTAGGLRVSHEVAPRRHQQELFRRLHALAGEALPRLGLQAVAYGCGPGSFTGLRIAASCAQGLAFSLAIPAIGLSTLETQARTLLRRESLPPRCLLLSTIDARMGEIYAACYRRDGEELTLIGEVQAAVASALLRPPQAEPGLPLVALGSGCAALAGAAIDVAAAFPDTRPEAQDMLAAATAALAAGNTQAPGVVCPLYLQGRGGWKTVAEQGRGA